MEKIINDRIYHWIEENHYLPRSQFGFRANRSCLDNLAILSSDVLTNWHKSKITGAVFLDIQGVYDNVVCDIIIQKLKLINLPNLYTYFIYNLISRREVQFRYNEINSIKTLKKGLPQGSVLSPLLYSLYVSDLEDCIRDFPEIKYLQFADDICLYCSEKNAYLALNLLEEAVDVIADRLDEIGLKLAPHKSQLCIFRRFSPKNLANAEYIHIRNTTIKVNTSVKFLGVTLQSNLKWNKHFDNICSKCAKPLNVIKFLLSTCGDQIHLFF